MSINATLIAQLIVFLILVWFTMKFVWPPIVAALDERARKIAEGLSAADKAKSELAVANQRVEQQLSAARDDAAKRLAEADGVKIALSLSDPNMVRFFKAGLLKMIGSGVDLLFANEDEAKGMAGLAEIAGAVEYLKTLGKEFVVTRGPKGALVWDGRTLLDIAPVPVKAVDTVGAGDLFAGAFLYGRGQGWDHRRAGALAAAASAKLVTQRGPRLTATETKAILQRCA